MKVNLFCAMIVSDNTAEIADYIFNKER